MFKQYLSPFSTAKCSKLEIRASMYVLYIVLYSNIASFVSVLLLFVQAIFHFIQLTTVTQTV